MYMYSILKVIAFFYSDDDVGTSADKASPGARRCSACGSFFAAECSAGGNFAVADGVGRSYAGSQIFVAASGVGVSGLGGNFAAAGEVGVSGLGGNFAAAGGVGVSCLNCHHLRSLSSGESTMYRETRFNARYG